ncbi:PE domain-containing protein [Mycobacterium kansasii]
MSFVQVEPEVVAASAAALLAEAVQLQAVITAMTPVVVAVAPPGCEAVSAEGAAALSSNNAQVLGMMQAHVVELVAAAQTLGDAGIAYQVQDLVGKGLLLV